MTENWLENKVFDEIAIGDSARMTRALTRRDIELFAIVSGDLNPTHLNEKFGGDGRDHPVVAHSILSGSLISAVLGTKLPGPGTVYREQDLHFLRPVQENDVIESRVTVLRKEDVHKVVILDCHCVNQRGEEVVNGTAEVYAPTKKMRWPAADLPEVEIVHHDRMKQLVDRARAYEPLRTAVVYPCDDVSLQGMNDAAEAHLIDPVLVGPSEKIRAAAAAAGIAIDKYPIIDAPSSVAAAVLAVTEAREGRVSALMKGSLHTDELMIAVVGRDGLRTERRMSHVFVMDAPAYKWPLLITDAAINIAPGLKEKADICQNAIYLAHDLGLETPKVALLAAVESINATMPATIDAAALCKMADRGQITGAVLDGPLAFDNAISMTAARIKKIVSPVAGQADILLVPNLEAGNMLAKQLGYLAAAESSGIVLGAKVPIILTSRADNAHARLASAALAVLTVAGNRKRWSHK